jgi:hypothetical protein
MSIMCRAQMVSSGDDEVYTGSGLRGVPTSSEWLLRPWAKCARSRAYKLVRRGSSFPSLGWWCMIVWKSNPYDRCPPLPFIVSRGGAQGEIQESYSGWQLVRPVWAYRRRVAISCRGGRRVPGLNCSFRDAWPSSRVVWVCFSLPEFSFVLPRVSISLGPHTSVDG